MYTHSSRASVCTIIIIYKRARVHNIGSYVPTYIPQRRNGERARVVRQNKTKEVLTNHIYCTQAQWADFGGQLCPGWVWEDRERQNSRNKQTKNWEREDERSKWKQMQNRFDPEMVAMIRGRIMSSPDCVSLKRNHTHTA